jgi:hypothetical protein
MTTYPRRTFVLSVLAACGTPLLTRGLSADGQAASTVSESARASQTAAGFFGTTQADAARAIGEAYLRDRGIDSSPAGILAAARDTLALIDAVRTQTGVTAALVAAVRRDFQEGRIIQLHGWVLSRTEVELCALTLLPAA